MTGRGADSSSDVAGDALFGDVTELIERTRARAASAVNTELVMLYWSIGRRVREDVLGGERAGYGMDVLKGLAARLTDSYGRGFGWRNLSRMVKFAQLYPEPEILPPLAAKLHSVCSKDGDAVRTSRNRAPVSLKPRSVTYLLLAAVLLPAALLGCAPVATENTSRPDPDTTAPPAITEGDDMATIYLAGGCFWGVEKLLASVRGVSSTEAGYANGTTDSPTYRDVVTGRTGYAETVRVDYDPSVAPLPFLLEIFFEAIDPTSLNRQGNDVGTQYRTGIYYSDPADAPLIERSLAKLQEQYAEPVVVEVEPLGAYASAEDYHQDYLDKNPGGYCHIDIQLFAKAAEAVPDASHFE